MTQQGRMMEGSRGREPRGFDAETLPHESRLPAHRAALPRVKLAWEDDSGAHEVRIDTSIIVGSSPSVLARVDDPLVSRLHAELTVQPDGVWVRDLSSKNGTFIEGVRVIEAKVPDGGRVRVGATLLKVTESFDATPPELWQSPTLGALVGSSAVMRELFARVVRVAAATTPVLLRGETGVGKELVARTIHARSASAAGPFVVLGCGSLGTSAAMDVLSAGVAAREGTLFLDEVADVPLTLQPVVLRMLETLDRVRVIASTQRDLPKMVGDGTFREDLYFRLAVLPIQVPPLRDRRGDLEPLVFSFLPAGEHAAVTPALLRELAGRPWRGNVRELRNFVERALTFGTDEALESLPLPSHVRAEPGGPLPKVGHDEPFKVIRDRWIHHLEVEYLRGVLAKTGGNVSAAAEHAGLDRAYVYRLIRKHGL